jgi:hypothetical protein
MIDSIMNLINGTYYSYAMSEYDINVFRVFVAKLEFIKK